MSVSQEALDRIALSRDEYDRVLQTLMRSLAHALGDAAKG